MKSIKESFSRWFGTLINPLSLTGVQNLVGCVKGVPMSRRLDSLARVLPDTESVLCSGDCELLVVNEDGSGWINSDTTGIAALCIDRSRRQTLIRIYETCVCLHFTPPPLNTCFLFCFCFVANVFHFAVCALYRTCL